MYLLVWHTPLPALLAVVKLKTQPLQLSCPFFIVFCAAFALAALLLPPSPDSLLSFPLLPSHSLLFPCFYAACVFAVVVVVAVAFIRLVYLLNIRCRP